jgi:hypothetical protein
LSATIGDSSLGNGQAWGREQGNARFESAVQTKSKEVLKETGD